MEKRLGEWLEPAAHTAIGRLIDSPGTISDTEIAQFLLYLELQRTRVPRQADLAKKLLRQTILRHSPKAALESIAAGHFTLEIRDSARFEFMRHLLGKLSPWFARMEWEVVAASADASFVTTDSPVSFYNPGVPPPGEAGIGLAGTFVFFPLSSRHLLLMRHPENTEGTSTPSLQLLPTPEHRDGHLPITLGAVWDRELVDHLNWRLSLLSARFVVASNAETLRRCQSDAA